LRFSALLVAASVAALVAAPVSGARSEARPARGQLCRFLFIHRVTRATGRHGWEVRFGATISCSQSTSRLELGGNLVSWGVASDCPECGAGWYVTSALTRPVYERTAGSRSLTVTGNYFERRRRRHKVWVTFAVQPVGNRLSGFHDTNIKKCQKQSADFYSCNGFSPVFR
jgi:hypothetical protein